MRSHLTISLLAISLACSPPLDGGDAAIPADATAGQDAAAGEDALTGHDTGHDSGTAAGWLRNAPDVDPPTMLAPDPGEEGMWAAARLSPPRYPFDVRLISYVVGDGAAGSVSCSGTLSHQLELLVSSDTAPPENEAPALRVTIPEVDRAEIGHVGRTVNLPIDPPIRLEMGEHLFVAVQLPGSHPDVLCVQVNDQDAYEGNRSYWSGATEAPYAWVQLDSLGLPGSLLFTAYGAPVP